MSLCGRLFFRAPSFFSVGLPGGMAGTVYPSSRVSNTFSSLRFARAPYSMGHFVLDDYSPQWNAAELKNHAAKLQDKLNRHWIERDIVLSADRQLLQSDQHYAAACNLIRSASVTPQGMFNNNMLFAMNKNSSQLLGVLIYDKVNLEALALAVQPKNQGKGLGRCLIAEMVCRTALEDSVGMHAFRCEVLRENQRALRCYQDLGAYIESGVISNSGYFVMRLPFSGVIATIDRELSVEQMKSMRG